MARKPDSSIRAAAQALAPVKPADPEAPWSERKGAYERAAARYRSLAMAHPRPRPLEHWKRVLADPAACPSARQMAQEAIEELEARGPTETRIAIEAEIQETARRIAQQLGEKEHDERASPGA